MEVHAYQEVINTSANACLDMLDSTAMIYILATRTLASIVVLADWHTIPEVIIVIVQRDIEAINAKKSITAPMAVHVNTEGNASAPVLESNAVAGKDMVAIYVKLINAKDAV